MQDFINAHPALSLAGFAVYFVLLWTAISFMIAFAGGWRRLAQRYRTQLPFPAYKRRFQSGYFRLIVGYRSVLTLASDTNGIHLGVVFPFRLGHPRLFIPWSDIQIEPTERWLFLTRQTLRFGPTQIPLRLRASLVEFLCKPNLSA
jgi:hypothetical protein